STDSQKRADTSPPDDQSVSPNWREKKKTLEREVEQYNRDLEQKAASGIDVNSDPELHEREDNLLKQTHSLQREMKEELFRKKQKEEQEARSYQQFKERIKSTLGSGQDPREILEDLKKIAEEPE